MDRAAPGGTRAGLAATNSKPDQDQRPAGGHAGRMTAITCYLHGIYPHSESLVAVTRDAARGRRPASEGI
jgi:hypothetical protein